MSLTGPPSSLVELRSAVWTGDTRDARHLAAFRGAGYRHALAVRGGGETNGLRASPAKARNLPCDYRAAPNTDYCAVSGFEYRPPLVALHRARPFQNPSCRRYAVMRQQSPLGRLLNVAATQGWFRQAV